MGRFTKKITQDIETIVAESCKELLGEFEEEKQPVVESEDVKEVVTSVEPEKVTEPENKTEEPVAEEQTKEVEPEEIKIEESVNTDLHILESIFASEKGEEFSNEDLIEEVNKIKLDKKSQLKKLVSIEAMQIAKKEDPQIYAKYEKAFALKRKLQNIVTKKFQARALKNVKERMASTPANAAPVQGA
jgi:hypothetical protein